MGFNEYRLGGVRPRLALAACVLAALTIALASSASSATPKGRYLLQTRGLWTYFEHRGSPSGYNAGELLEVIGGTAARSDVAAQLRVMRAMGVNELTYEMRSADGPWPVDSTFPNCRRSTALGPLWPNPTDEQLAGLKTLFGLANQYGMRIMLILNTTHMEKPESNAPWLRSIVGSVKDLPALDLVVFGGDRHTIDALAPYDGSPDSCGGESEAPLWLGPDSLEGRYVQWALTFARSLGVPPEKLGAEAIVGDYRHEAQQGAGPAAQGRHLWRPVEVLRTIYDRVGFPARRTYPLSLYAHRKCAYVESWLSCSDASQDAWVQETLATSKARVEPEARLTLIEFGAAAGDYQRTVEHLGAAMLNLGLEGGTYWKWADESNDPRWTNPAAVVKQRGTTFTFNPQQRELADLYGFHLINVPNGSFEEGTAPWRTSGTAQTVALDENTPWRGKSFLRLVGTATSPRVRVSPSTRYTTTANLRFTSRVGITFRYLTCKNKPTAKRKLDTFHPATPQPTFQTFPFVYTTPIDACWVQIELSAPATLDVDAIR
jgi:hypothetical protein